VDRSRIALVIPALNEAATIGAVVERLADFGRVIVVDDGSSDGTAGAARQNGAEVVTHPHNRGYDGALGSGFARAAALDCAYVITFDADGQHPANLVPKFIAELDAGADLVLGIRDHLPRISEKLFQITTRTLYGIQDPFCGMKGYRMELYRSLGWFDSYRSIGTELMLHAVRHHARVAQLPVPTRERVGQARIGRVLRANFVIMRAALIGLSRHFACR
jgi:glycosyltransferase involved in cell wall biosynthesis